MHKRRICIFLLTFCLLLMFLPRFPASAAAASEDVIEEWQAVLVNPWNKVPKDHTVTLKAVSSGQKVDVRCYDDLNRMLKDCRAAGYSPYVLSGYRTQWQQEYLYERQVNRMLNLGYSYTAAKKKAATSVAIPGTSEHQLGLAADIVDYNYQSLTSSQANRPTQKWLMKNSWKYGFILRYPSGKSDITGIIYEPWHYRYVGLTLAKILHETGLTLEEYTETLAKKPVVTAESIPASGGIQLSWYPIPGADTYEIWRCETEDGSYKKMLETPSPRYKNLPNTPGQTYFYRVRAVDTDDGTGVYSAAVSAVCAPAQPTVTRTYTPEGKIRLTWNPVHGAATYELQRAKTADGPYYPLSPTPKTTYTNVSILPGETYFYQVRAVCADGTTVSAWSAAVSGTCQLPTPVVTAANVPATGKIKLTWQPVEGAVQYEIYRASDPAGPYLKMTPTSETTYTSVSITPGVKYYFRVRAVDAEGHVSAYASVAKTCRLSQPKVTFSNTTEGKNKLTWNAVEGAAGYEIRRSTRADGGFVYLRTVTATQYINVSLKPGDTYYYNVRAVCDNPNAVSEYSKAVKGVCTIPSPTVKISLNSAGKPKLTWNAVDGAVQYEIYRASSASGTYTKLSPTSKTVYENPSAAAGRTYYYKVRAVSRDGKLRSAFSHVQNITLK